MMVTLAGVSVCSGTQNEIMLDPGDQRNSLHKDEIYQNKSINAFLKLNNNLNQNRYKPGPEISAGHRTMTGAKSALTGKITFLSVKPTGRLAENLKS